MDRVVIDCFRKSAMEVLGSELGSKVEIGEPSVQAADYLSLGVTGLVGVTGRLKGLVILGLTEQTALSVVSHILGNPFTSIDDMVRSGIAELGNVVVGSSVTALANMGYQCGITPPAVLIGEGSVIAMPNLTRLALPISTLAGNFEMQLLLRENGAH